MARRYRRVACITCLAVLVSLMTGPVSGRTDSSTPEEPASPMIQFQHGRLRVRLQNVPWDQVLHDIERQTGVAVQVKGELAGTVTQAFDALPLEKGLRQLFHNVNMVMFYAREGGTETRVSHVWLVPNATDTPPTEALTSPAHTAHEPDERLTALQTFATQGNLEGLQQALIDSDQHIQAMALDLSRGWGTQGIIGALLRAATSDQPATRLRALTLLQETDLGQEGQVLSALAQALTDPDVTVKTYSLYALTARGGAEAVSALGQALRDPDASIRQMAIESIASKEEGRALLQEALSNDDDTVRALAAFWLEKER